MNKRKMKIISVISVIAILLSGFCGWVVRGNLTVDETEYTVTSDMLPESFSGYEIAQVSDFHNSDKGDKIISMLEDIKPDMIAITGDLIDSRHTDVEVAMEFVKQAVKIAPCYYVSGNHEGRLEFFDDIKKELDDIGVNVIDNSKLEIKKNNQKITLLGIEDPRVISIQEDYYKQITNNNLNSIMYDVSGYTILLAHRPEHYDTYKAFDINLVLSGHAHGGQFRVPFLGGVLVPNQGFFPEYDAGEFKELNTTMIISRGIGNSVFPIRINNNPEVVVVKLEHGESKDRNTDETVTEIL